MDKAGQFYDYFIFGECLVFMIISIIMLVSVIKGRLQFSAVMKKYALAQLAFCSVCCGARSLRYLYKVLDWNQDTPAFTLVMLFDFASFITILLIVLLFQINILQVFIILSNRIKEWHLNLLKRLFIVLYPFVLIPCLLTFGFRRFMPDWIIPLNDYTTSLWGGLSVLYEAIHACLILVFLEKLRSSKEEKADSNRIWLIRMTLLMIVSVISDALHFAIFLVGYFNFIQADGQTVHDLGTCGVVIHVLIMIIFNSWTRHVQFLLNDTYTMTQTVRLKPSKGTSNATATVN